MGDVGAVGEREAQLKDERTAAIGTARLGHVAPGVQVPPFRVAERRIQLIRTALEQLCHVERHEVHTLVVHGPGACQQFVGELTAQVGMSNCKTWYEHEFQVSYETWPQTPSFSYQVLRSSFLKKSQTPTEAVEHPSSAIISLELASL